MSDALQGERRSNSDLNGHYVVGALPPGNYTVVIDLAGFQSARVTAIDVSVGGTANVNATLELATRTETVTVTAAVPSPLSIPTVSRAYRKQDIDVLPVGRRPVDLAELTPGVTLSPFNQSQVTIAGAFAFDNVFMINGVDVNDNVFGTANNLFIEDAVEGVAVLTSAIPASYGRFSGGVVNIVTKSGGNTFAGSFRETLSNPTWIAETPREERNGIVHKNVLNWMHEGTVGGPIVRDRLWFFGAGRYEQTNTPNTFAQTGGAYTRQDTNKRGELKLTGTFKPGQTVQGSYINNSTEEAHASGVSAASLLDASTLVTRQKPNHLLAFNYNGALTSTVLAKVQYSQKQQTNRHNGGTSSRVEDSPFLTLGATAGVPGNLFYHAPFFDATDPEERNNRQVTGSLSYLLSTPHAGSHDLSGGVEYFLSRGIGGNSQTSTNAVFATDYLVDAGRPVVDANGTPVPQFVPDVSQVWTFQALRGAKIDLAANSVYFNDHWLVTPRLTLDLGTRFEAVNGSATGDITTVDATSWVPRLAAAFDISGNGETIVRASYGHYSGKYSQVQFSANTNVGRPSEVDYVYTGPAGQGSNFAPGFDLGNYTQIVFANFPVANVRMADDLRSPIVRELTFGAGRQLGARGYAKGTFVSRNAVHFIEDFINLSNGVVNVPLVGNLTNRVFDNTDVPTRHYRALQFESSYRWRRDSTVAATYNLQLRNEGNFVGESANQPGLSSPFGDYPEVLGPALDRLMPQGRLDGFQRHELRIFGSHTQSFGRFGSLDVAPIWRVNSGAVYSLTASLALTSTELARDPGYPTNDINRAVRQTVYFGERGQYSFKGYGVLDLAATYRIRAAGSLAPWFKVEIYNALNNQKQIAWDKTVTVDRSSLLDANGIPTGYIKGPRFGQATSDSQFPQPYPGQNGGRAARLAFGMSF